MSSVSELIREFEKEREAELAAALELCEEQRYGEIPIIEEAEPSRPWEEKIGTADAIKDWRRNFVCLRVRGRAIFPEEKIRYDDEEEEDDKKDETKELRWSDSDDGDFERVNFWNETCEVDPFDQQDDDDDLPPGGNAWHIEFRNGAIDESKIFPSKKKTTTQSQEQQEQQQRETTSPEQQQQQSFSFVPELESLKVVGVPPPRRGYLLAEEDEGEILAMDGECPDFLEQSAYDEPPGPDPDDEFPPPVVVPRREPERDAQGLSEEDYREINEAVLVLEALSPQWAPESRADDPLQGLVEDEWEGYDDTVYDDDLPPKDGDDNGGDDATAVHDDDNIGGGDDATAVHDGDDETAAVLSAVSEEYSFPN